jgi:hypothetical protein
VNLTSGQIRRKKGKKWETVFTRDDVVEVLESQIPTQSVFYGAQFSLSWFVEKVLNNQQGKPLKLEAFQAVMLDMLWNKKFPMVIASRGAGKSFILAVYALIRAILVPGSKVVIVGAGYRQAKVVFKYIEQLYNSSPLIQEAIRHQGGPKYGSDSATLQVGLSYIKALPIGDGTKVRGERATVLLADEFASIPEDIFNHVLSPFTAVHANPAERAETVRFIKRIKKLGASKDLVTSIEDTQGFGNQIVISGTPSYKHNHFYHRYKAYLMFINSGGNLRSLRRALEERALQTTGKADSISEKDVNSMIRTWKHYAVYQLPYYGLPEGFLDEDNIRSDRATFPKSRFAMEYEAQFPDDSDGFIKRSWIERATPSPTPEDPGVKPVSVELYGDPRATYVMGLDPARWNDNFGCVVLKLTPRGKELVYCTAWRREEYTISAKKIREICKRFNISYICMDKGGGGDATYEWLCKKQDDVDDSELIWLIPDQLENKSDLSAPGRNILEFVNFAGNIPADLAHSVEAAIEQCEILFPDRADELEIHNQYCRHFNAEELNDREKLELQRDIWGLDEWEAAQEDEDSRMGVMQHIDECINETCAIVRTVSPKGTESFDLPKLSEQPEGLDMRRRDRWTALLLANYAAKIYLGHGHRRKSVIGAQPGKPRNYSASARHRGAGQRRGAAAWFNPH